MTDLKTGPIIFLQANREETQKTPTSLYTRTVIHDWVSVAYT